MARPSRRSSADPESDSEHLSLPRKEQNHEMPPGIGHAGRGIADRLGRDSGFLLHVRPAGNQSPRADHLLARRPGGAGQPGGLLAGLPLRLAAAGAGQGVAADQRTAESADPRHGARRRDPDRRRRTGHRMEPARRADFWLVARRRPRPAAGFADHSAARRARVSPRSGRTGRRLSQSHRPGPPRNPRPPSRRARAVARNQHRAGRRLGRADVQHVRPRHHASAAAPK